MNQLPKSKFVFHEGEGRAIQNAHMCDAALRTSMTKRSEGIQIVLPRIRVSKPYASGAVSLHECKLWLVRGLAIQM
eukprot:5072078-Pleurochrysis_carterae.AAC.2